MQISTYRTKKIVVGDQLFPILDKVLPKLPEKSVVVITSKIVSICEGRVVKNDGKVSRDDLVEREAEMYLPASHNQYGFYIAVKNSMLILSAGIDESNGNGYFVLWPKNPQLSAFKIWKFLRSRDKLHKLGVINSDSHVTPLRWGTIGISIAHCGFRALNDYRHKPDIFGRKLKVTQSSVRDGLAAAAVCAIGEGNEQTPLAVISDAEFVQFQNRQPTRKELNFLKISLDADAFAPFLKSAQWQKGGSK